ncbi:hypothetical protein O181_027307 [Austropuccinia psidii MF-1]|uniref:Pentatricopeptide repeat domain-containing protein n=1 Tax=Austropuccinia psidii MF-1 TaxID=1389203 RepID=A0A9Q3CSE0_9BASI|nr:hypothetical protein [Austropuccinia psidii MF-1]
MCWIVSEPGTPRLRARNMVSVRLTAHTAAALDLRFLRIQLALSRLNALKFEGSSIWKFYESDLKTQTNPPASVGPLLFDCRFLTSLGDEPSSCSKLGSNILGLAASQNDPQVTMVDEAKEMEENRLKSPHGHKSDSSHFNQASNTASQRFCDRAWPSASSSSAPYPTSEVENSNISVPGDLPLSSLTRAMDNQDFQLAIKSFQNLPSYQKSRLSTHTYDCLFSIAATPHENDKSLAQSANLNEKIDALHVMKPEKLSYTPDYCQIEVRLKLVEKLFQSIGRLLTDDQLLQLLYTTIRAEALRLRSFISSSNSKSSVFNGQLRSHFLSSQERISSIIQKLSVSRQAPIPTAQQLAEAIPFEILQLYSRFLVVFHQPNQGFKLIRKVYYACLISRQKLNACHQRPTYPDRNEDVFSDSSLIETGSLIITILRSRVYDRLAALKLATRMITIGGIYPHQCHFSRLLRCMYMSKPEWDSVIRFQMGLTDPLVAHWLRSQIAIVEAQDGRVQRALSISAEVLQPTLHFQMHSSDSSMLNMHVFSHAIQALLDCSQDFESSFGSGVRGAVAIRARMIESGLLPHPDSDDLILRRVYQTARHIQPSSARHELLQDVIGLLFPKEKIVSMRLESSRIARFTSHPGKSPEAFRLMSCLTKWDEWDLALQVFQSMSRYGYVASLTAIPYIHLKRLLYQALRTHPELAIELYQHLRMAGCDISKELHDAVRTKAIHMGDSQFICYLLKITRIEQESSFPTQLKKCVEGFSFRKATPRNVIKTIDFLEVIYERWPSFLTVTTWQLIINQIKRLAPYKVLEQPQLENRILHLIKLLRQSQMDICTINQIEMQVMEYLGVVKLMNPSDDCLEKQRCTDHLSIDKPVDVVEKVPVTTSHLAPQKDTLELMKKGPITLTALIMTHLDNNRLEEAIEAVKLAVKLDVLVSSPTIGRLLTTLIDHDRLEECVELNKLWRGMSWKFKRSERGDDHAVVEAMNRIDISD